MNGLGTALDPHAFNRRRIVSATERVNIGQTPRIEITTAGITLTLTPLKDRTRTEIANISDGDVFLDFNIILQGNTFTAPVTMPAGDVYDLFYDLTAGAFRF